MSKLKIVAPKNHVFEKVALEFAATFYEIGRSQGLKSKYKSARSYARANLEKFLPKAIEHCIDQLNNPNVPNSCKELIHDELMRRVNDPSNVTSTELPKFDIKRLLEITKPVEQNLIPNPKDQPSVIVNSVRKGSN